MSSYLIQTWAPVYSEHLQSICLWYVQKHFHVMKDRVLPLCLCCRWDSSLLMLQLEAAARDRVQRGERQEDEAKVPSDLQVFLHSTAQFGPSSMRELMVNTGQSKHE